MFIIVKQILNLKNYLIMKKLTFVLLMLTITAVCFAQPATVKEKLKNLMKDEPKVKDYVLTDVNYFYASVTDDGTNRNGYAEYLYYTLKSEGIIINKVIIVKYGSQKDPKRDNAYGIKLGEFKP
jgi:hypothetical protein